MANVLVDETSLQSIANAIREKNGTENTYKPSEMPQAILDIQSGGGADSYYNAFWDSYTQNGERTDFYDAFSNAYWTDTNFGTPKYVLKPITAERMFRSTGITEIADGILDTSLCTNMNYMFQTSKIKKIPTIDCSSCTALTNTFREGYGQESITDITLVNVRADCTFSNTFYYTGNLVNLNITGAIGQNISFAQSSELSMASVNNVGTCCIDLTGQTAKTVTFHKNVIARMSDEQKAVFINKNWTIASST